MLNLKISSPGKVILHGEHSVVFGKPALAGVIGIRTNLHIKENAEKEVIHLNFVDLEYELSLTVSELNKLIQQYTNENSSFEFNKLLSTIEEFVSKKYSKEIDKSKILHKTIISVLFLLCGVHLDQPCKKISYGFSLQIISDLKMGSGLGSSASFGVCLSAAFLILAKRVPVNLTISKESLELISSWAFNSERVMHGTPSGVDNTICTYGGIVKYVKGQGFSQIQCAEKINILLVDSLVDRSTAKLVSDVRGLNETFPDIIDHVLRAMEEVVNCAIPIYQKFQYGDCPEQFNKLESLFRINNDLLKTIGVSHARLEVIFQISAKNGFFSKITGAGGGGYAIILLPHNYKNKDEFHKLCADLSNEKFPYMETTIGGDGLCVEDLNLRNKLPTVFNF